MRRVLLCVALAACGTPAPPATAPSPAPTGTPAANASDPAAFVPAGWTKRGSAPQEFVIELDRSIFRTGRASAHLRPAVVSPTGYATIRQGFRADEYRGKRVRMTAWVRTRGVARVAHLWLRVDRPDGSQVLDHAEQRGFFGDTDWMRQELVLDVAPNAAGIAFGFIFHGTGDAWVDDFQFEVVDKSVPTTETFTNDSGSADPVLAQMLAAYATSPTQPRNPGFEEG